MDLSAINEFPERIHPMLVRELRARLRDPRLLFAIIGAHIILAAGASIALLLNEINVFLTFLWPVTVLMLALIAYTCGGSLRGEMQRGNFQLLQLVGIDARRLVLGKWLPCFSLLLLATLSLLPWIAFCGNFPGINPLWMGAILLVALLVFAFVAATELWAAAHTHVAAFWVIRLMAVLQLSPLLLWGFAGFQFFVLFGRSSSSEATTALLITLGCSLLLFGWLIWHLLGISACLISSEHEDFLFNQRWLAWLVPPLFLALAWAYEWADQPFGQREIVLAILNGLLFVFVASSAFAQLCHRPPRGAKAYRRANNLPVLLAPLRPLLQPVGPAAAGLLIWGVAALALLPLMSTLHRHDDIAEEIRIRSLTLLIFFSSLLLCSTVARLIRNRQPGRHRGLTFIVIALILYFIVGFSTITGAIIANDVEPVLWVIAILGFSASLVTAAIAYTQDLELMRRASTAKSAPTTAPAPAPADER